MYILQTKIEGFNSYSRIVYKYIYNNNNNNNNKVYTPLSERCSQSRVFIYSMILMHVNRTQVTNTHTE